VSGTLSVEVRAVTEVAPPGWDALTVDVPGGHVLQSAVWAVQASEDGWQPRFVSFTDGAAALVLTRQRPPLPGFLAYASRGPVAGEGGARGAAARALALGRWARQEGATILAVDPELDADAAFEATLAAGGFVPAEEIQPSRHRLVASWAAGTAEETLFARLSKTTRQRVRSAQRRAVTVREDAAGERLPDLGRFLDAAAIRKGFTFSSRRGFLAWWRRLLEARRGCLLVAEAGDRFLGALLMYRQGGHLATAFSADDPAARPSFAGTMQLLRWEAMRLALAAGMPCLDLGGVDITGARERPAPGDVTWGLYEHKAGFGARWVESAGAHELVLRPAVYRAGLVARSARRALRRG